METPWYQDPWVRATIGTVIRGAIIFGTLAFFANELSGDEVYKFLIAWLGTEGTKQVIG